jgi:hypothetical protein
MTTGATWSLRNGILVQDGLDPLAGIKPPGPGVCVNCGEYLPHLSAHYSNYFGYFCIPPYEPNGSDPRPILVADPVSVPPIPALIPDPVAYPSSVPKFSTLTDDFSTQLNPGLWYTPGPPYVVVVDGQLQLLALDNSTTPDNTFASIGTNSLYDLTESHVFIELVSAGDTSIEALATFLFLQDINDNYFGWYVTEGVYTIWFSIDGGNTSLNPFTTLYEPTIHRWFRLRHTDATVHIEHSPDCSTWMTDASVEFAPQPMWLYIQSLMETPGEQRTTTIILDNLNTIS